MGERNTIPKTTKRRGAVSGLIVATPIVDAVLACIFRWHTQLGSDDTNISIGELAAAGSVTSIPLAPLIALVVFTALARSRHWWGTLGVVGLCVLAGVFFAASLAEVEAPFTPNNLRAVLLSAVAVYISLALLLLLSNILELVDRARMPRSGPARSTE